MTVDSEQSTVNSQHHSGVTGNDITLPVPPLAIFVSGGLAKTLTVKFRSTFNSGIFTAILALVAAVPIKSPVKGVMLTLLLTLDLTVT